MMEFESVGINFNLDSLWQARERSLEVIQAVKKQVMPGRSEKQVRDLIEVKCKELGAVQNWHPPQVRFAENTLLPFGIKGAESTVLKENDIFFFDIGPVFFGHEGDVGRPFSIGDDEEMKRCCLDAEIIWHEVREFWAEEAPTGVKLYDFANECASQRGWLLTTKKANGHRVADYPHGAQIRKTIQDLDFCPAADRWILEIQIRHLKRPFGAFYEDLLR